jgi:hypothetical protein
MQHVFGRVSLPEVHQPGNDLPHRISAIRILDNPRMGLTMAGHMRESETRSPRPERSSHIGRAGSDTGSPWEGGTGYPCGTPWNGLQELRA